LSRASERHPVNRRGKHGRSKRKKMKRRKKRKGKKKKKKMMRRWVGVLKKELSWMSVKEDKVG
jgi:hypothetical protein